MPDPTIRVPVVPGQQIVHAEIRGKLSNLRQGVLFSTGPFSGRRQDPETGAEKIEVGNPALLYVGVGVLLDDLPAVGIVYFEAVMQVQAVHDGLDAASQQLVVIRVAEPA